MRMTVLGGGGAWPTLERACSGYLLEEAGFRLVLDPGYATVPKLLDLVAPGDVDAVLISHGHPDHCADLNPLLRARHLSDDPPAALPVIAPPGAVDAVLALDAQMLAGDYAVRELAVDEHVTIGPFRVRAQALRHFVPNLGVRLEVGDIAFVYTGDGGADPRVVDLAAGASLLLAEATFPDQVPEDSVGRLSSARQAGEYAAAAGVERLVLTHLWPGTDPAAATHAARKAFGGPISVAGPGLVVHLP